MGYVLEDQIHSMAARDGCYVVLIRYSGIDALLVQVEDLQNSLSILVTEYLIWSMTSWDSRLCTGRSNPQHGSPRWVLCCSSMVFWDRCYIGASGGSSIFNHKKQNTKIVKKIIVSGVWQTEIVGYALDDPIHSMATRDGCCVVLIWYSEIDAILVQVGDLQKSSTRNKT